MSDGFSTQKRTNWTLYSVPAHHSYVVENAMADTDSCKYFTAITNKDIPNNGDLHEASGSLTVDELNEKSHRLCLQLNLEQLKQKDPVPVCDDDTVTPTNITSVPSTIKDSRPSIVDILMNKRNHFPRKKIMCKINKGLTTVQFHRGLYHSHKKK